MKRIIVTLLITLGMALQAFAGDFSWKAQWISKEYTRCPMNTWMAFRQHANIDQVPESVVARIAADTKYWLWINGELVVREGGLKRGPAPGDTYFDKLEIAPYLKAGDNVIAVLVWYFGCNGFSHLNSGTCAMIFQAEGEGVEILSDNTWECHVFDAFSTASGAPTNYRLPESSIRFDARNYSSDWVNGKSPKYLGGSITVGVAAGQAPFGKLVERPIPQWKDYGLKDYASTSKEGNTLICRLPYNAQVTPYLKVKAPAGKEIVIFTDHDIVTKNQCVRAEYVTKKGSQEFECFGWMNGQVINYVIPEGVEVEAVKYRETGYDTEFSGSFECNDPLLNEYWQKAQRTLYVCMRDTYYDCPDRERAQWWGDEVNELGMAFYALSPSSAKLAIKGIRELAAWQRPDGVLHAPIPAGNYYKELPMQILASVGWYGARNLYYYSADSSFVADVYPAIHRYLHEVWQVGEDGMPVYRTGDWDWPDAGEERDRDAQLAPWYVLALKAEAVFADMLGKTDDARLSRDMIAKIAANYDSIYWTGKAYRSPQWKGRTDDRVQALAVLSGLAGADKYDAIAKVLEKEFHATTYMQHYVLDALFEMGRPQMALDRMRKLYPTIMKDDCSTLYEHWNYEGTSNHAWGGSGVIILGRRVAGIEPLAPGFRRFTVRPCMADLKQVATTVDTKYGAIVLSLERSGAKRIKVKLTVPEGTEAEVTVADGKVETIGPGYHELTIKQ